MRERIERFRVLVQKAMGPDYVGFTDQYDDIRRVGFATAEPDRGEGVKSRYVDAICDASREAGLHVSILPFALCGTIVYECAIRRALPTFET